MEMGKINKGTVLSENSNFDGRQWVIGSFIGVSGTAETYEAALYDGSIPAEYPLVVKIVPRGNGPLPMELQFYLDNADPRNIDLWKRKKKIDHIGVPSLLGLGCSHEITGQCFQFIVLERYGKDLWSLLLERGRKFEEHTVYKIALQILSTLKYIHSRSYVFGDFGASNIVVDVATQNQIYLVNYRFVSRCTTADGQVNLNDTRDDLVKYMSRDAHRGVQTKRGDVETLFYNMVQWLGLQFPWEENSEDSSLVRKQKRHAFANVEQFLMDWSKKIAIPSVVAEYMKLLATLNGNKKPIYWKFMKVLDIGLKSIYHVRTGYLEFSISNSRVDDQIEEVPIPVNKRKREYNSTKTYIRKIRASVEKLARIISENCRHEGEVKLRDTGPYSLIEAIYILMGRKTDAWQNRLANAWETDEAALKTITKQFWASKAKGIARNEEALKEMNADEEPNGRPSTSAQANTNELNCNLVGRSISNSHFDAISPNETPLQEDPAASDLGNTSPLDMLRSLLEDHSFPPFKEVQSPLSRPGNRGFRPFQMSDQFLDKNQRSPRTSVTSILEVHQQSAPETDSPVELPSNYRIPTSEDDEHWPSTYEWLNTWLNLNERNLMTFGSISSEPRLMTAQVHQVEVLLDVFRSQMPRIFQLTRVLARQPSNSVDAQKLERIQQRWREQLGRLEDRGRKLGEASLGQAREALRDVSSNLDALLHQNPEEQLMRKMEILAGQLEAHRRALLANADTVIEQLRQVFRDADFNVDLRIEHRSMTDLYDNLQHRISVEKAAIARSLNDERQFDDSCKKIIVWLAKELDTSEKLIVAADTEKLQQLQEHHQNVMGKETEVNELLAKGREFLSKQQNLEILTLQQSLLDLMKSQWDRLKRQSLDISSRVQTCVDLHDKYQKGQKLFLSWLPRVEDEFKRLQPTTFNDIEMVLKNLAPLNDDVREKLAEFKGNTKLGEAFIGACDVENDDAVKNELINVKERWDKLNNDLRERIQSLEDIACRFNVFNEYFKKLEQRVDELKLQDTVREITDPNQVDSAKGMRKDADSLSQLLKVVRRLADELKLKASEQRIDTSCLSSEVDRMTARIESLKIKLSDSLAKIYEQRLASLERDVKPKIEDVKPNISLPKINWKPGEVVDLSSDDEDKIDEKLKDLPLNANAAVSGELIDLASDSNSEFDLSTQQLGELLEGPEPAIHTCENRPGEAFKDVEQVSKVGKSLEKRKRAVSESRDSKYEETRDGKEKGTGTSDSKVIRMQGLRLKIQKKLLHKRI